MLVVGDLHAKRNFIYDENHISKDRFLRCFSLLFDKLIKLIISLNENTTIFTGDIIDTSETIDAIVLDTVISNFDRLKSVCKNIIVLCGNHDKVKIKDYDFTPLDVLRYIGVQVRKQPSWFKNVFLFPYGYNLKHLPEGYHHEIMITHLANKLSSPFDKEAINPAILPADIIINGHIHKTEQFKLKNNKTFINIGVPYPTRKGEEKWKNRIIQIKDGKIKSHPLHIHKVQYKKIEDLSLITKIKPDKNYEINTLYLTIPTSEDISNDEIKSSLEGFDSIYIFREKKAVVKNHEKVMINKLSKTKLFRSLLKEFHSDYLDKKLMYKYGMNIIKEVDQEYGESSDIL